MDIKKEKKVLTQYIFLFALLCLVTQSCPTLFNPVNCSLPGSSVHGDSLGKNTGVGFHALLQGIFPTQELSLGHLQWRQILYHLSHEGSPRILEWVTYPFFRGSSWPRNWNRVSCIAGGFFNPLSQQGSPKILEWVAYSFSRGTSWPRNWTKVSCISGGFFLPDLPPETYLCRSRSNS